METTHINLWSGPRNISTAMMYSFAQRADCRVVDEPLYAHYLIQSGLPHPGRKAVLESQNHDGNMVMRELMAAQESPVYFFKQMTHHLVDIDLDILEKSKNILLIRHPAKVLASYSKVIEHPTLEDIGIRQSAELYHFLKEKDAHSVVVDSDEVLLNPAAVLGKLCFACDIPFDKAMLEWEAGARAEDGVWAKYWYGNVHKSTGFGVPKAGVPEVREDLKGVLKEAMGYYEVLAELSL